MGIRACRRKEQNQCEEAKRSVEEAAAVAVSPSRFYRDKYVLINSRIFELTALAQIFSLATRVGDWVRVVKGAWAAKGESKFSEPLEVRKVYKYTVLLSDGNMWNRGKVIRVPVGCSREKLPYMGNKSGNNVDDNTSTSETPLSKREHEGVKVRDKSMLRRPKRLDDYVEQ
ncbi:hypothetical protein NDU88_005299 [Pleurodeles waltl]|uniref:Uncharacterized protein n=1 Tax=Pleurodeles waltl TaxID=8319 RepID=A0AAV7LKY3_PLEWA|nr:hypothetical protein NDU88_005299 [Pleurodeles waltl]